MKPVIARTLAVVTLLPAVIGAAPLPKPSVVTKRAALPLVYKPGVVASLTGRVIHGTQGVAQATLTLYRCGVSGCANGGVTQADGSGYYTFSNISPLEPGEYVLVRYRTGNSNPNGNCVPGHNVFFVETGIVTSTAPGPTVQLNPLQTKDIALVGPGNSNTVQNVTLPTRFEWVPRSDVSKEVYRVRFFWRDDGIGYAMTSWTSGHDNTITWAGNQGNSVDFGAEFLWDVLSFDPVHQHYAVGCNAFLIRWVQTPTNQVSGPDLTVQPGGAGEANVLQRSDFRLR